MVVKEPAGLVERGVNYCHGTSIPDTYGDFCVMSNTQLKKIEPHQAMQTAATQQDHETPNIPVAMCVPGTIRQLSWPRRAFELLTKYANTQK